MRAKINEVTVLNTRRSTLRNSLHSGDRLRHVYNLIKAVSSNQSRQFDIGGDVPVRQRQNGTHVSRSKVHKVGLTTTRSTALLPIPPHPSTTSAGQSNTIKCTKHHHACPAVTPPKVVNGVDVCDEVFADVNAVAISMVEKASAMARSYVEGKPVAVGREKYRNDDGAKLGTAGEHGESAAQMRGLTTSVPGPPQPPVHAHSHTHTTLFRSVRRHTYDNGSRVDVVSCEGFRYSACGFSPLSPLLVCAHLLLGAC